MRLGTPTTSTIDKWKAPAVDSYPDRTPPEPEDHSSSDEEMLAEAIRRDPLPLDGQPFPPLRRLGGIAHESRRIDRSGRGARTTLGRPLGRPLLG